MTSEETTTSLPPHMHVKIKKNIKVGVTSRSRRAYPVSQFIQECASVCLAPSVNFGTRELYCSSFIFLCCYMG